MISSSKNIVPLLNKVVIKKVVAKQAAKQLSKTTSGLYIPESNKAKGLNTTGNFNKAQIVSISEHLKETSILKAGDFVLYHNQLDHLTSVKVDGETAEDDHFLLVNMEDLVAKLNS